MANNGGMRSGGIADRTPSRSHVVEEWVPSSAWTEDSNGHYLLVDLPDFKKEEVKLQVDNSGQIVVSGERLVNNNSKVIHFEQKFKLPENSDTDKITGKFDGEILYVTVPKQEETSVEPEYQNTATATATATASENHRRLEEKGSMDSYRLFSRKYWRQEDEATPLEKALEMIKKNKGILLTAVLAFSLGIIVTRHKLEFGGE
ncbi:17.9 kDa class I heat shock protein-like [Populus nigra]|uniref:17.9 kDa class I heat shock protein-like n=1 Tax=Populus nigra TaxID=3691 RepID=UPI002B266F13|nr:17.9 kDa class I heat shock protein-like [Populus nigra]